MSDNKRWSTLIGQSRTLQSTLIPVAIPIKFKIASRLCYRQLIAHVSDHEVNDSWKL